MKALVTGANGQLGRALRKTVPAGVALVALGSAELDVGDRAAVERCLGDERPDLILNAAAYTAVDKAEGDEAAARRVNADGVRHLADAARGIGARLVHVSTDFVFEGRSSTPYAPDAPTGPLGVYGRTKLAGEQAAGSRALVVRTAWVYGAEGGNFVRTMLRLMGSAPQVRVVADQIGTPTWVPGLAETLWALAATDSRGILHHTDSGVASWYDFAVAIQEEALALGLLEQAVPVVPIATADYPTPARRPSYSVLDCRATHALTGGPPPHWRANLRRMLEEVKANG